MKSLAAALVEAQKKMPVVHKTATANTGTFSYSYATLDQLIEKTKPVLIDHGLAIAQFPTETSLGAPGLRTVLLHAESGESLEATVPLLLNGKNDMQTLGSAISYARRYGWAAVLGIANDEDDDGAVASAAPVGAASSSTAPVGTGGRGGAVASTGFPPESAAAPISPFEAPASARGGDLCWKYGEHQGLSIAATPLDFVIRYAEEKPDTFMGKKCKEFLAENDFAASGVPDSDIPFDRTIDGLGG